MANLQIGDKVSYYCYTRMAVHEGTVTAIDVPVKWLRESPAPLGVEINGSLTRAYYRGDKSRVEA